MRESILGLIQGLTEFLPVSSSGHLAFIQYFYQGLDDSDILLNILLHVGTLLVVLLYYRTEILKICQAAWSFTGDIIRRRTPDFSQAHERKMILLILVGSIPTALIGFSMQAIIEQSFGSLLSIGVALLVTGTALYVTDTFRLSQTKRSISYTDALIIGTVQGIAIFPGISRSGSTISAAILLGIERSLAARYSFLLSIPAILGAVALEAKNLALLTQTPHLLPYLFGMIIAFVTGYFAITALIKIVVKQKLSYFSFYCWGLGSVALLYHFFRG